MNSNLNNLEPAGLWKNFISINAIPRPSKREEKITAFICDFGMSSGLDTTVDQAGNVRIKKPASPGMEGRQPVILQSHLDMVHQKNADTVFDFDAQGISMYADGDWVKAHGTTLGADNGIGVATILTILAATEIIHPSIEALFTVDEETGMTGAMELKKDWLHGSILLNLDTEEDNELTIGCAGGIDVTATGNFIMQAADGVGYSIKLSGLTGGHSGVDIQKGRANANKLMNRLLSKLAKCFTLQLAGIDGGSLRNAIPRESSVLIAIEHQHEEILKETIHKLEAEFKEEYRFTDPGLKITLEKTSRPEMVADHGFSINFLRAVYACPNGVYRLSPEISGLVQSSNNVARITLAEGKYQVQCLTRSSVDSEKNDLADAITAAFELIGSAVTYAGDYPGWEPKPGAPIVQLMTDIYTRLFNGAPIVNAVHAGLECGIIGKNYPDLQMISLGPNIYGAHSPDERVQVSSVQKFWKFLLETLQNIPEKI